MKAPEIRTVPISEIDLESEALERFAIAPISNAPFAPLPVPALLFQSGKHIIISGHGRILDATQNGIAELSAAVFSAIEPDEALALCAKEIAFFRPIDPADRVVAIGKLSIQAPGMNVSQKLADALGIEASPKLFDRYRRIGKLGIAAIDDIRQGTLAFGAALATIDAPADHRKTLLDLFTSQIRPNQNTASRIAQNLAAVAIVRAVPPKQVLALDDVAQILDSQKSGPQKTAALDDLLAKLRYPELTKVQDAANKAAHDLGSATGMSIGLPKNLEGAKFALTMEVGSAKEVTQAIEKLEQALRTGKFGALFEVLD
jgi:hypothetical protein